MKAARLTCSLTPIRGKFSLRSILFSRSTEPVDRSQLGVWRTMGCDRDDARISYAHVLPVDMPVVL